MSHVFSLQRLHGDYKLLQCRDPQFPLFRPLISGEKPLKQSFSTEGDFVPQGTFGNMIVMTGCDWHLLGRGQGCC